MPQLMLVSHRLCPYVQRAAISLAEKAVPFERVMVDLADKPAWFAKLSPLGKVPLLLVRDEGKDVTIFESAVILEYLEETQPRPLHPEDPLERAWHRAWIEFGSALLNRIAAFYNAETDAALESEARRISEMFSRLEGVLGEGPWFSGTRFSLVDAVYGPIFRYFDVFDRIDAFVPFDALPKTQAWRRSLTSRASVKRAVDDDYPERLFTFLRRRKSALSARAARVASGELAC